MTTSTDRLPPLRRVPRALALGATLCTAAVLAGCGAAAQAPAGPTGTSTTASPAAPSPGPSVGPSAEPVPVPAAAALPGAHVHAAAFDPGDGALLLATHDGLFRYGAPGADPVRTGPSIDLMGFAVAGPGLYYASGHPGPGSGLPQPVGLVESTDAGATWTPLSRQGVSDFHALTASRAGIVGFDGRLRSTTDGREWTTLRPPVAPFALAASPAGSLVLATSETGPVRSTDAGATWSPLPGAPLLQVVAVVDEDVAVGVTPDGRVSVSDDGGTTWEARGSAGGPPRAVAARTGGSGALQVVVVTETLTTSLDGGATFEPGTVPPR